MLRRRAGMILTVAALLPAAAAAKTPEVLMRTGKWVVSYDKDACHLAGSFGTGKDEVVARFTRYEPSTGFDLALYGTRLDNGDVITPTKLDFGAGGRSIQTEGVHGTAGKLPAVFFSGVRLDGWRRESSEEPSPQISAEREAQVAELTVSMRGRRSFKLAFKDLAKPFALMRDCTSGLVKSWGYDPDEQASLLRPASGIGDPATWLTSDDYPAGAVMRGHNGIVQIRLDVDAEGKATGCYVLMRTNPDDFADATCRAVMRRAKFQPALDAKGRAIRSFYVRKVQWRSQR